MRNSGVTLIMVGHVTKDGSLAGPRVLEHIVDTVLYFEGDTHSTFRLVRAFKNRFGAVNELGVFAMTDRGLRGVSNPRRSFSQHSQQVSGSCILVTQEGTRPCWWRSRSLVDSAHSPSPRRLSVGLEQNRLAMLLAVLHRHAGVVLRPGRVRECGRGVKITEPAADPPVLLAIVSLAAQRAAAAPPRRLWRDWPCGRDPPRATWPGAPAGSRQAGLRYRPHSGRERTEAGYCRPARARRRASGRGLVAFASSPTKPELPPHSVPPAARVRRSGRTPRLRCPPGGKREAISAVDAKRATSAEEMTWRLAPARGDRSSCVPATAAPAGKSPMKSDMADHGLGRKA